MLKDKVTMRCPNCGRLLNSTYIGDDVHYFCEDCEIDRCRITRVNPPDKNETAIGIVSTLTFEQKRALYSLINKLESPTGELAFLFHTCNSKQLEVVYKIIQETFGDMRTTIVEGTGYEGGNNEA